MGVGQRIKERLNAIGMAQAELARRVGLSQPAINGLIRGAARSTPKLHLIAAALGTTPAYLTGATDDPHENAPPAPPASTVHHVMLAVALPPERALARMFDVMLEALPPEAGRREQAQLLAQWLPASLGQLRDILPPEAATQPRALADATYESRS